MRAREEDVIRISGGFIIGVQRAVWRNGWYKSVNMGREAGVTETKSTKFSEGFPVVPIYILKPRESRDVWLK